MTIHALRSLKLVLLAALMLSACSPGSPTPPSTVDLPTPTGTTGPAPTITPTQTPPIGVDPAALHGVNLQVWHAFSGGANDVFIDQVARFNTVNEWGILVTQTGYGEYTTLFDAVNTTLDSGGTPDLVAALPEQTLSWNASASVVDLTPYLGDPAWGLGSDVIADIPPVFWAQDNLDGKQLGVPAQRSARFLYYNKTWAHELGFDSPPARADEFRQQACAANASFRTDANLQNDGFGGWIVDTDWQTTYSWLLAFGGGVVDGNAYGFRTDPNLAALQFLKKLYDDHCAWLSTEPTPFDSFARRSGLFVSGDLAEAPMANESMSRLNNADEWTLAPFPGTDGSVLVTYGPSYSVLKSSPEKQLAAWLFARWLLSLENQAQWVEATGLFPLFHSVLDIIGPYRTASPQWDSAVGDLSLAQGVPQMASWRKVRYVLEDGTNFIFQTNIPVDQIPSILTEMDSTAKEISNK
ncbi:MAG: extracellular solute-binding protein [Chloroflexi bacterium]|nr:extracellular solute-binding protein [Chloroflexota bacterium]